jgi:hypothetical protein
MVLRLSANNRKYRGNAIYIRLKIAKDQYDRLAQHVLDWCFCVDNERPGAPSFLEIAA